MELHHQSRTSVSESDSNHHGATIRKTQGDYFRQPVRNRILRRFSANILREISPLLEEVKLEAGEYIYQAEQKVEYLYFPETAVVSDFQILEDGRTLEVAMTGKEGVVGISSVFESYSAPNWFQVSVAGKAWRIAAKNFRRRFNDCRRMQKLLHEYINSYISQISQKVICNSFHSVEQRLCCWLLMAQSRCEKKSLRLTQEQIAGFLGVHRPSVTLITQALREKGIIDCGRGKISICNREKLIHTSCDCYISAEIR